MSRTTKKRLFDLTTSQLAILVIMGCLLGAALGLLGGVIAKSSPFILASPIPNLESSPPSTLTIPSAVPAFPDVPFHPTDGPTQLLPTATNTAHPTATTTPSPSATPSALLRVYFFSVGRGDSILVVSPAGRTILIDGGKPNTGIVAYLQELGIHRIDLMISTHAHADHIGGLVDVLKVMPVARVVSNGQADTTPIFQKFLDAVSAANIPFEVTKRGDLLSEGGLTFSVLGPKKIDGDDLNHNSLVLRLVYQQASFLFMGDADVGAEADLLAAGLPVQSGILKVGHHAIDTASSPQFINQVKPYIAIYTARSGDPNPLTSSTVLATLADAGAQVYGTDTYGTITVSTDGQSYQVITEKGKQGDPTGFFLPTVQQADLTLDIASLTSPIALGASATLVAKTMPGAYCTITVYSTSGQSTAKGLDPETANVQGVVSWNWTVGAGAAPGVWKIVVTTNQNGQMIKTETPITVTN
jgi:competence protein ComEC